MSRDEIISMARAADPFGDDGRLVSLAMLTPGTLKRFAALVAAKEREACAKLVERLTERKRWIRGGINGESTKPCELASAIRARSAKGGRHG